MANNFRNILQFILPRQFTTGDGEKVLYTTGMMLDAAAERFRQGLLARFPSYAPESALKVIGKDRGIPRGRTETNAHYAARLKAWRYPRGHRVRGNAYALLEQVSEYFGGVKCWTVDATGRYREHDADGTLSSDTIAWTWDTEPAGLWSRFWIGIDGTGLMTEHPDFGDPDLYGGDLGDTDYSTGQLGVSAYDVEAIRNLTRGKVPWKPAGARPEWVIVDLDGLGPPTPDATWEHWSVVDGDHRVPSRDQAYRYWSLRPDRNVYAGDPTRWNPEILLVDGTVYTPSTATFTTLIPMPDGSSYTPDGSSYTEDVPLIDDGGVPV